MSRTSSLLDLLNTLEYRDVEGDFPDDLLPFIGFLISKAAQSLVESVDTDMEEIGITSKHYGIMLLLSRQDGLPQATIGEKLRIDRTTMVKLVDKLEEMSLVERHRDPNDRRAYALSLSEQGHHILPEISQRVIELEKSSLSKLEKVEIQELFRILLKLLKTE